jgi:hypothetical protein
VSALKGEMAEMSMPRKKRIAFWMPLAVPLLPVHLDEHRREPPLAHRVELERERVAEVAQDEVDEGLGRALEVEDVGPAIDVGEQEVRHLLQARDEPEQVAGVVVAAVVLRKHAPQVEAPGRGRAGRKPVKLARS